VRSKVGEIVAKQESHSNSGSQLVEMQGTLRLSYPMLPDLGCLLSSVAIEGCVGKVMFQYLPQDMVNAWKKCLAPSRPVRIKIDCYHTLVNFECDGIVSSITETPQYSEIFLVFHQLAPVQAMMLKQAVISASASDSGLPAVSAPAAPPAPLKQMPPESAGPLTPLPANKVYAVPVSFAAPPLKPVDPPVPATVLRSDVPSYVPPKPGGPDKPRNILEAFKSPPSAPPADPAAAAPPPQSAPKPPDFSAPPPPPPDRRESAMPAASVPPPPPVYRPVQPMPPAPMNQAPVPANGMAAPRPMMPPQYPPPMPPSAPKSNASMQSVQPGTNQAGRKKIGMVLVQMGYINPVQLDDAARQARMKGEKIGRFLVRSGLIGADVMCRALALQSGLPMTDLNDLEMTEDLTKLFSYSTMMRHGFVPFDESRDMICIAVANPLSTPTIRDLEQSASKKIEVFLGREDLILKYLNKIRAQQQVVPRRFIRYDLQTTLTYQYCTRFGVACEEGPQQGTTLNISEGGLLMEGPASSLGKPDELLRRGTCVNINIPFTPPQEIKALCRLKAVQERSGGWLIGLEMLDISTEDKRRLKELCVRALLTKMPPKRG
jgi:hypothetical protein